MTITKWVYIILISISFSCLKREGHIDIDNDCSDSIKVANDTSSIHFFIISDWGWDGAPEQTAVAHQMDTLAKKVKPEFVLTCGDNLQLEGVKSIYDTLWKTNYEQVYNFQSLRVPWYPALGNHDYSGSVEAEIEYSKINKYWCLPASYYTFIKGSCSTFKIRFIILDTQDLVSNYDNLADTTNLNSIGQIHWLTQVLANSKQDWIVVVGHHPVFSASNHHGDTKELIYMLKPILEYYKVDFYICGHDHNFEHARLAGKNTEYIVTGTGGNIRPVTGNSRTIFCLSSLGFTYMSVSAMTSTIQFINSEGDIEYSYTKIK